MSTDAISNQCRCSNSNSSTHTTTISYSHTSQLSENSTQHNMADTLITIPGVAAHHVLGESTVTLGAGDLNVVPGPSGNKELLLTIGSAGFTLHKGTPFGTLEGDPRAYVFSPEIEGVSGG